MTSFEEWLNEISKPMLSLLGTGSFSARQRWEQRQAQLSRERREQAIVSARSNRMTLVEAECVSLARHFGRDGCDGANSLLDLAARR
jgi:hypothetical protein